MPRSLDLTENAALTRILLSDTLAWRQRLVERFTFGSGEHVRVSSSYQCEFPPGLLEPFLPRYQVGDPIETVSALVPVTSRPKQAMLGFDCFAPEGQFAPVSLRADAGALQRGYVREMIGSSSVAGLLDGPLSDDLIEAICVFTPGLYRRIWDDAAEDRRRAVTAYLEQGVGVQLCPATLSASLRECDSAAEVLCAVLGEAHDPMFFGVRSPSHTPHAQPSED